jgi:hypothetical protein
MQTPKWSFGQMVKKVFTWKPSGIKLSPEKVFPGTRKVYADEKIYCDHGKVGCRVSNKTSQKLEHCIFSQTQNLNLH